MPQFFIDQKLSEKTDVEIRGADAHHIARVLRLEKGDWLILSDGAGNSFRSTITDVGSRSVKARIEERLARRAGPTPPTLAIASIRSERLEWAVQKCVELGCRRIIPFGSARTVRKGGKTERLRRIALEAAKQSGLPAMPEIDSPIEFSGLCAVLDDFSPSILLYEGERERDLKEILKERASSRHEPSSKSPLIIVGPEGGFTSDEVEAARASGVLTASIGSQILRVETAAVAAMAICQYELGNMGVR
jgi:16S rRNA (uracil1498-N3)-methyltransferase